MLDISYKEKTFQISYHGRHLGSVQSYNNPYHQANTYLRLNLIDYDCTIAEPLFQSLQTYLDSRPLQIMLSSAEQEKIHFLTVAGFFCKRKCYEFEVTRQDYFDQTVTTPTKAPHFTKQLANNSLTTIKQSIKTSILGLPVNKTLKRIYLT